MTNFIENVRKELEGMNQRSAWNRGVNEYAQGFVDDLEEWTEGGYITLEDIQNTKKLENILLNGAINWIHYSWSGCSLCYNYQIAERLCSPSELKKTRNGMRDPNSQETWLDVQARALAQAYWRVRKAIAKVREAAK
jgi:hypothetical protein